MYLRTMQVRICGEPDRKPNLLHHSLVPRLKVPRAPCTSPLTTLHTCNYLARVWLPSPNADFTEPCTRSCSAMCPLSLTQHLGHSQRSINICGMSWWPEAQTWKTFHKKLKFKEICKAKYDAVLLVITPIGWVIARTFQRWKRKKNTANL